MAPPVVFFPFKIKLNDANHTKPISFSNFSYPLLYFSRSKHKLVRDTQTHTYCIVRVRVSNFSNHMLTSQGFFFSLFLFYTHISNI